MQCLLKKQSRASDEQQELRGLLSQGWWEQWVCAALERVGNSEHSQKKEAHSCSSSFCPRPRIISCKAPSLGVHTSCFGSYTAWANHSAEWLLITAAHGFFLSITSYCALGWCNLMSVPTSHSPGEGWKLGCSWGGLAPSWRGFWFFLTELMKWPAGPYPI